MLSGCSTTSQPKPEEPKAVEAKVEPKPTTVNVAAMCPEVKVQDGLTNGGLAEAFKTQRDLHRKCVQDVQRAVDRKLREAPKPAAPAPKEAEKATAPTPACRWWVGLTGEGC